VEGLHLKGVVMICSEKVKESCGRVGERGKSSAL